MSNGIRDRQNEENSITMLASQRQLYNEVGTLDKVNLLLSMILPFLLSMIQEFGTSWSCLKVISGILSISMLIISIYLGKMSRDKKSTAALIQQKFDVYVYQMPWDKRLFGTDRNLNSVIVEKSKNILNNKMEKKKLIDWYTPLVDAMDINKGILMCQKENYRWDAGLRMRYRCINITGVIIVLAAIVIIGLIREDTLVDVIFRIVIFLPMLRWLVNNANILNYDIERLKEQDEKFQTVDYKDMGDLQMIQRLIYDHRKSAIKVPNKIYELFKDNDEDREHQIVKFSGQ